MGYCHRTPPSGTSLSAAVCRELLGDAVIGNSIEYVVEYGRIIVVWSCSCKLVSAVTKSNNNRQWSAVSLLLGTVIRCCR